MAQAKLIQDDVEESQVVGAPPGVRVNPSGSRWFGRRGRALWLVDGCGANVLDKEAGMRFDDGPAWCVPRGHGLVAGRGTDSHGETSEVGAVRETDAHVERYDFSLGRSAMSTGVSVCE